MEGGEAVGFLLNNSKQLLLHYIDLISKAENNLAQLQNVLGLFKAFLKDATKKVRKDQLFKEWERQIREVVYDVEDVIDTCTTVIKVEKGTFKGLFKTNRVDLAKKVKSIIDDKVKPLFEKLEFNNLPITDVPDTRAAETRAIRQKRQGKIVGFEDEAEALINQLKAESVGLEVISVVGMPGLGKTTLAWKIHEDPNIKLEFHTRIWVDITEDFNIRNVLLTILGKLTKRIQSDLTIEALSNKVKELLLARKFLMVMDDIWTNEAWDEIRKFLPMSNKNGRVLITSRHKSVAWHANPIRKPRKLRFLVHKESWELLQYEVYGGLAVVNEELVEVGKVIAEFCNGLPLSIIVIGGILVEKTSKTGDSIASIKKEWEDVSVSVKTYLVFGDKTKRLERIISLSYDNLPYELRDCFLYLGMFPADIHIHAKRLTLLWIAEGFVEKIPGKCLEEVALDNLKDLINRNLVMVEKESPYGEAKTCRVHDTIRQFCKTESRFDNINFFEEISKSSRGILEPAVDNVESYRRICIHSYVHDFLGKKPKLSKARSFLCFPKGPIILERKEITSFIDNFDSIRVFDAEKIRFPIFPTNLKKLIHLRYLTLTLSNDRMSILPEAITGLWNLQMLIVDIPSRTLVIRGDVWKMMQLRRLKTKSSIILEKVDGKGKGGENLHTLSRLSPESCTEEVFGKAKNLVVLGIQGELSLILQSRCLEKLGCLNKLKLKHYVHRGEASEKPLPHLPEPNRFPPRLRILVLSGTSLDWKHMPTLAKLVFLEVLKLKENAFIGNSWKVVGDGFYNLELLHIERADLITWTTSASDPFPKLRSLFLINCEKLTGVPLNLGKNLETLYMERVSPSAVSCAQEIKAARGEKLSLDVSPTDKQ